MDPWLETIVGWLPQGPLYYAALGFISFFESLALIGIFVPGSVLIVLAGFLAAHGQGDPLAVMAVAALGAILGDTLSFVLGARLGPSLFKSRIMARRRQLLNRARDFFVSHGGKSVFFGRFVGFLRPFIPMIAGGAQMSPPLFMLYAVISGILWGLAYPGLGYFFGASWHMVQVWTGRFSMLLAILAVLLVLNHLFWKKAFPLLLRLGGRLWGAVNRQAEQLKTSPLMGWLAETSPSLHGFLLDRFSHRRSTGFILTLGFAVSLVFALAFFWISQGILRQTPLARIDQQTYALMRELQHPTTDYFFRGVTHLGGLPALLLLGALALAFLILHNRDFSTLILVFGMLAGEALVWPLKFAFERPRPETLIPGLETLSSSFPSAHAFNSLVFYGLLAYFLLGAVRFWESRFYLAFCSSFLVLLIGFSRIYLGLHWLSDVLAGFVLGGCWLTVLVTACEMRFRYGEFPLPKGLRPVHLAPRTRVVILAILSLAVVAGLFLIIRRNL